MAPPEYYKFSPSISRTRTYSSLLVVMMIFVVQATWAQDKIGINTSAFELSHKLTITSPDSNTLRLIANGIYGSKARFEFGDLGNRVFLEEDVDDQLNIFGLNRISLMGGDVGVGIKAPIEKLHVRGNMLIRPSFGDARLIIEADSSNTNESDNPMIEFRQDGNTTQAWIGFDETKLGANNFGISTWNKDGALRIDGNGHFGFLTGPSTNETFSIRGIPGDIRILKVEAADGVDIFSVDASRTVGINAVFTDISLNVRGRAEDFLIFNAEDETGVDRFQIQHDGEVFVQHELGIGTNSPAQQLTISKPNDPPPILRFERSEAGRYDCEMRNEGGDLIFSGGADAVGPALTDFVRFGGDGRVGIGTTTAASSDLAFGHLLSVNGKIACTEVRVQPASAWPDYVFSPAYDLLSLEDLEESISVNKHLPGIPSSIEIAQDGLELGNMQIHMMEKIEELTLYILELNREIINLKEDHAKQAAEIITLKMH